MSARTGSPATERRLQQARELLARAHSLIEKAVEDRAYGEGSPPSESLNYLDDAIGMLSPDEDEDEDEDLSPIRPALTVVR